MIAAFLLAVSAPAWAQPGSATPSAAGFSHVVFENTPPNWSQDQDQQNMMKQLGIRALRPGVSGNPKAPNPANYDPAKANPWPDWPDALTLPDGGKVTTPEMWWQVRRPQIVEDFEREVYGRIPAHVPKVTWSVQSAERKKIGSIPAIVRHLVGHVDNSACPSIEVNLDLELVTPAASQHPVPMLIRFVFPAFPPPQPTSEALLSDGWGYAVLNPTTVQPDSGAWLIRGIIGLVNHGQPRKPHDWGALRAWAWGASRVLDYLETDPAVDARHVGIEGVSRYGKAALVAEAFDSRFYMGLIGSSGEGGVKPSRRVWGEQLENLTTGEYYWMAGNFMKYGAEDSTFGRKTAGDLPVESPELIALCAPRLTFVSYGIPARGDAKWLDHQGSFMATVAAQPVFRLLGARGLGVPDDYRTAVMPPVNSGLLGGQLAWRQHDGGHTDAPNIPYFIAWADRFMGRSGD